ncbi:MAG: hypothetical protein CMC55_00385 [Flavobacteriaceae bacterium]|nr:hypothetical protein [Flavobacteriaceae bacterium]
MENFKIVNRNTKATYFLNEKEKETFFKINYLYKDGDYRYDVYNLSEEKAKRNDKMLDVLAHLSIIGASVLMTIIYIQTYC